MCFWPPVALVEDPGRLEHDVDAEVAPRQRRGVALGEHLHPLAAGLDEAVRKADVAVEGAEDGVVLQEVCHRRGVAEVVDGDDLDVGSELLLGPEEVAADPPESVDAYANCHGLSLLLYLVFRICLESIRGLRRLAGSPLRA